MRVSVVEFSRCCSAVAGTRSSAGQTMNTGDPVKRGSERTRLPRARPTHAWLYSYEALRAGDPAER